jgi:putative transposase
MTTRSDRSYRFPPEVISMAVWAGLRQPASPSRDPSRRHLASRPGRDHNRWREALALARRRRSWVRARRLVQKRRDTKAAKRLMRKLFKKHAIARRVMITDKLHSYEGRDPGLLTAWQANRQRVHRSVQWPSASRVLNAHWFLTLADARKKLEDWRKDYNEVRPHGAIGNKPPVSLLTPAGASSPPT